MPLSPLSQGEVDQLYAYAKLVTDDHDAAGQQRAAIAAAADSEL